MSTIKAREQFMNYALAKMIGFFKSHVIEVLEDEKSDPNVGPLAFFVKVDG